jgi:hypothetical protein
MIVSINPNRDGPGGTYRGHLHRIKSEEKK